MKFSYLSLALVCLSVPAFGQNYSTIFATSLKDNTGASLTGQACFTPSATWTVGGTSGSAQICGTVTSGAINAANLIPNASVATPPGLSWRVDFTKSGTTFLSIYNVVVYGATYQLDSLSATPTQRASGTGTPTVACVYGSTYTQTDGVSGQNLWTCTNVDGIPTWYLNPPQINAIGGSGGSGSGFNGGSLLTFSLGSSPTASITETAPDTLKFGNGSSGDASASLFSGSLTTGSISASTVTASSFLGDGSKLTTGSYISVKNYGATGDGTTDDTAAIQAAINAAAASSSPLNRTVLLPAGTYCVSAPISIPLNMTSGTLEGVGLSTSIKACSTFTGSSLIAGVATLSVFTLQDMVIDANDKSGISTVVNLARSPESSIRNRIRRLQIVNVGTGAIGLELDGCEDSTVEDVEILTSGRVSTAGTFAMYWQVPGGNLHVYGSTWFQPIGLQYQSADMVGTTTGPITVGAVANALVLDDCYIYAGTVGSVFSNFTSTTSLGFGHVSLTGCYVVGATPAATGVPAVAFTGNYSGTILINSTFFDPGGSSAYTLFSSATTAASGGYVPAFILRGSALAGTTARGTLTDPNVAVQISQEPASSYAYAFFGGGAPAVQFGTAIVHSFPMRVTSIAVTSTANSTGCTTPEIVSLTGTGAPSITLSNGTFQWISTNLSYGVPLGATPNIQIQQQAAGCSSSPTNLHVLVELQPQ